MSSITFKQGGSTCLTTVKDYDALNRLKSINSAVNALATAQFAHGYAYNDANQRTKLTLANGAYWDFGYDALGQVTSGKKKWADATAVAGEQFEYTFDDIGNRTQTKAGGDTGGANLRSASYTPNLLNQYAERQVPGAVDVTGVAPGGAVLTVNTQSTERKGAYFRKELSVNNASAPVWQQVDVARGSSSTSGHVFVPQTPEQFDDPATATVNEGYDADGNQLRDGRWDYKWDAENRLVRMTARTAVGPQQRLEFEYDHRSRRTAKKVWNNTAGTGTPAVDQHFIYDGWNLLATLQSINNQLSTINSFAWGLDLSGSEQGAGGVGGLLWINDASTINGQPSTHFAAFDGNGNVAALIHAADGTVSANYEYGPFAELLRATGPMAEANPFQFSTKFRDAETGLHYYGFRYFGDGRWISRDPIWELGGINLYGYVGNSPLTQIDSLGLQIYTPPTHPPSPPRLPPPDTYPPEPDSCGGSCGKSGVFDCERFEASGFIVTVSIPWARDVHWLCFSSSCTSPSTQIGGTSMYAPRIPSTPSDHPWPFVQVTPADAAARIPNPPGVPIRPPGESCFWIPWRTWTTTSAADLLRIRLRGWCRKCLECG